ncbi:MAG: hypothetical protein E6K69_04370 [Nitrospirae bacterium]|nr:MAG: hypothetical protein E6K69_04370 [Nitrospirota bacterium]
MAEKLDPEELVTPEELAISNMWETATLIEVLGHKGVCAKQEVRREKAPTRKMVNPLKLLPCVASPRRGNFAYTLTRKKS